MKLQILADATLKLGNVNVPEPFEAEVMQLPRTFNDNGIEVSGAESLVDKIQKYWETYEEHIPENPELNIMHASVTEGVALDDATEEDMYPTDWAEHDVYKELGYEN